MKLCRLEKKKLHRHLRWPAHSGVWEQLREKIYRKYLR
jgi:hypothetical protein